MRISDWSSDVCSSDLLLSARAPGEADPARPADYRLDTSIVRRIDGPVDVTLVLNRVSDQRAIWSTQIRVASEQLPEFDALAPAIAQIAGGYGLIVRDPVRSEERRVGKECVSKCG